MGDLRERVAVVGGGVAGIVAALDLAQAGAEVVLLEVRPRLGGAAYSVEREGMVIDNGQHVFLRCCTAYRELLARLGSSGKVRLQERLEIPLLYQGGRVGHLRRSGLPAPAHLGGALMRFGAIPVQQRLAAVRAARALSKLDPGDPALDGRTLGSFLEECGQDAHAIAALWDMIALPTLNLPAREASLALGAFVFQEGLLIDARAGDIGLHARPLGEIIGEPALQALTEAGVEVRLSWRAREVGVSASARQPGGPGRPGALGAKGAQGASGAKGVVRAAGGARLEVRGGSGGGAEEIECGAVVVALPHPRAADLLPEGAAQLAARIRKIGVSPIVNLHVLYDRRVCEQEFAAAVDSDVQYIFDRTSAVAGGGGVPEGAQCLAVSLSGADEQMGMSVQALRERYLPAIERVLPQARQARVVRFLASREHAATFRAAPGVGALRPGPATPVRGLVLAGAWTATGWPATLEGAALSGHAAARAVLSELGGPGAAGQEER